jgi:hypothetical protein
MSCAAFETRRKEQDLPPGSGEPTRPRGRPKQVGDFPVVLGARRHVATIKAVAPISTQIVAVAINATRLT